MRWILFLTVAGMLFGCTKDVSDTAVDLNAAAIASAKKYFEDSVLSNPNSLHADLTRNTSLTGTALRFGERTVDWQKAVVQRQGLSLVVLAPLQYARPFFLLNPLNGFPYEGRTVARLAVYTNPAGRQESAMVTQLPDSFSSPRNFTGLLLIEDWYGAAKEQWLLQRSGSAVTRSRYVPVRAGDRMGNVDRAGGGSQGERSPVQGGSLGSLVQGGSTVREGSRVPEGSPVHGFSVEGHWKAISVGDAKALPNLNSSRDLNGVGIGLSSSNRVTDDAGSRTIITCYQLYGVNYSAGDPEGSYWTELLGCQSQYIPDWYIGWGSLAQYPPEVSTAVAPMPVIVGGGSTIGNFADYIKCFDNIPGSDHQYTVQICVDQPVPGTRTTWGIATGGDPVNVGHTFFVLTQTSGTKVVQRNVGFYPVVQVHPLSPSAQGELRNNEGSEYNVSLTVTVTSSQFHTVLQLISQATRTGYLYNLNSNNCSTFAVNVMSAIGISLPRTIGYWTGGGGINPGDLGEDIKKMPLQSNMKRSLGELAHSNTGTCL